MTMYTKYITIYGEEYEQVQYVLDVNAFLHIIFNNTNCIFFKALFLSGQSILSCTEKRLYRRFYLRIKKINKLNVVIFK